MAVTIIQEPQLFSPASNPLVFTFTSDQTAQVNFSYIIELYVNASLHSTHQVFPESATAGKFDASQALRSFVSSDLPDLTTVQMNYSNAVAEYQILVYEKYGTPPIVQANAASSTLKAFNGALRHQDWIQFDYTQYDPSLVQGSFFMTNFPRNKRALVGIRDNVFLAAFQTGAIPSTLIIELWDITGASIVTDFIALTATDLILLNLNPDLIQAETSITGANFDDCFYYTVYIDYAGVSNTETFTFYMDTECNRYERRRIHWLNKYGVWDSFTFNLVSQESTNVTASTYSREKGVWNGTAYEYPLNQGQKVTYNKYATDTMIINSDWIHEYVQNWLAREIYESPRVLLDQGGGLEPLNVTNANYTLKQKKKDGLMQEQLTVDKTYTYNSQLN